MANVKCSIFITLFYISLINAVIPFQWDNAIDMDDNFHLMWHIKGEYITFEVQARTLGYIGLGFTRTGEMSGSDIAIGWVHQGRTFFQDRHIKRFGDTEPAVDPAQDYILMLGYENATHTVMRFRRKLDTCDISHDVPITNDTMRIIYMYHEDEPRFGSVIPGSLPNPQKAFKGYKPIYLTQKLHQNHINYDSDMRTVELRNQNVELPLGDDSTLWCKIFKLQDFNSKHHLVKYEPVFDTSVSNNADYLEHITLYECQGATVDLELMSRDSGRHCYKMQLSTLPCNQIAAVWAKGSQGFTFPSDVGYTIDSNTRFFLMETHYSNRKISNDYNAMLNDRPGLDSSGLRLYTTTKLRHHEAGILSIGMDSNWRHIIPPGQEKVISEGHCVEECTRKGLPPQGISIFAVMMQTHSIGREIKLRQIRNNAELLPIARDNNIDPDYKEFKHLPSMVRAYPGDRFITECTYDSSQRKVMTLGGQTSREERCMSHIYYYPRQRKLTTCNSSPSLPTVLHSMGIQELALGSNPVLIRYPMELAGMSLEYRLKTYDWQNQFKMFQQVTRKGTFLPSCLDAENHKIPGTELLEGRSPNITKMIRNRINACNTNRIPYITEAGGLPVLDEDEENIFVIEGAAKSKVSRSSTVESMSLSRSIGLHQSFVVSLLGLSIFIAIIR